MKSTEGQYYAGLDHLRALAAYFVFTWHFLLALGHHESSPPFPPLSLLTEGHTGVALFMTLSGYLFTKLLDGREIHYVPFILNRLFRLLPLLLVVLLIASLIAIAKGETTLEAYVLTIAKGIVAPSLPNGGWSITVEFHFYLILPVLLAIGRRSRLWLLLMMLCLIGIRAAYWLKTGSVHGLSYWTLVGRFDQFVLGMLGWHYRALFTRRLLMFLAVFAVFYAGFYYFDSLGGYAKNPSYPSPHPVWIVMPTIEGLGYMALIVWYDNSVRTGGNPVLRFIASIGTWSYSVYLLHFFIVFELAEWIHKHVIDLSNLYVAMAVAPLAFLAVLPFAALSYRLIEAPFLRRRTPYIVRG